VNGLVSTFPERYGAAGANLVHPGDSYSYDIFSQVGTALQTDATSIFGPAYPVQRVIAIGIQEP